MEEERCLQHRTLSFETDFFGEQVRLEPIGKLNPYVELASSDHGKDGPEVLVPVEQSVTVQK